MKTALEQIAEVRSGVTLRGPDAGRPVPEGPFRLIRIADLTSEGTLIPEQFISIAEPTEMREESILRQGDVVFACRGNRTQAAAYLLPETGPTIVGNQFFVLRPRGNEVSPEYLAWAINSPESQKYFSANATGSYVQLIPAQILRNLEIYVPSLDTQHRIVSLHALSVQEQELDAQLTASRRTLLRYQLQEIAKQTPSPL